MSNEQLEMSNGKKAASNHLYTLIQLENFKAILGIDDRDDKLSRFCLVTAACSIEQYCKRRLLKKQHFEVIQFFGDLVLPLREYPVISINNEQLTINNGEKIGQEFYRVIPDCGSNENFPYSIELSPAVLRMGSNAVKAVYFAGYPVDKVPADLASACLELASWNMSRYKGRRDGMTGNIRGADKEGEHFEMSMPENVKTLLEPYRRKTI
jgi:hypothetical protein